VDLALRPSAAIAPGGPAPPPTRLANDALQVDLSPEAGIAGLRAGDGVVGGADFLSSFVTYRAGDEPERHDNGAWTIERPADGPDASGWLQRARLSTRVAFPTPEDGRVAADIQVTLSLPANAPWIVADVEVAYPYTRKRDTLHSAAQKLRRYLDLRWVEVAPFQLHPRLDATREAPLRVWKHNLLGVTSYYDLDYARVNPRNASLDAFNHQVTAGWVAVSDRKKGLLLATDADVRSSFAFAPMRLRERDGSQALWLNPFGSYYGRQLDYGHLDGNGVGAEVTAHFSSALRPNGPSYNGRRERFSLLLAPYAGDAPPEALQAEAFAFFAAPSVVYRSAAATADPSPRLAWEVRDEIEAARTALARRREGPLPVPRAFLVNPTLGAVDVVWDEPDDARIDGYEIAWRAADSEAWQEERVGPVRRRRIANLHDGASYAVRMRAVGAGAASEWTAEESVRVGPVEVVEMSGAVTSMSPGLLLRLFASSLRHLWVTR